MKIRMGFVSNSSSSSFVFYVKKEDFQKVLDKLPEDIKKDFTEADPKDPEDYYANYREENHFGVNIIRCYFSVIEGCETYEIIQNIFKDIDNISSNLGRNE